MTTTTVATRSNIDWHERNPRALNRALTWSFGIHIGAVVLMFVLPRSWFSAVRAEAPPMVISLQGMTGTQKTSGMTPISSSPVEQAVPQPKPQPVRPEPTKPDPTAPTMAKTPPTATRPADTTRTPPSDVRPPTTGKEVREGTARAQTDSTSLSNGLTLPGGDGTGGETDLTNFCCMDYIRTMSDVIQTNWQKDPNGRGRSVIKFTIRRDGSIVGAELVESSGSGLLDRAAQRAVQMSKLPQLPQAYTNPTLIIRLGFVHSIK